MQNEVFGTLDVHVNEIDPVDRVGAAKMIDGLGVNGDSVFKFDPAVHRVVLGWSE